MSTKVTSTLDPRIQADVESRNRVQTQIQALLDKPAEDYTAQDHEGLVKLQAEFDGLTDRISVKQSAAEAAANSDFTNAMFQTVEGMTGKGETPYTQEAPGADKLLWQAGRAERGAPESYVAVRLRSEVLQMIDEFHRASPSERELRQAFLGQASGDAPFSQDVIARISGTNVDTVAGIQPQNVEGRFIEVLRNINGPHKCGLEVWYTPDLAPRKLPMAVPGGTNPRTSVPAQRDPNVAISGDNNPTFPTDIPNPTPREFAALFGVERSAELATPAMVGAKVAELLAREIGEQTAAAASIGAVANTSEGFTPNTAITAAGTAPNETMPNSGSWPWWGRRTPAAVRRMASTPTFENVLGVMGGKPDFPATMAPMGDVWHMHKQYAFTLMSIKGSDMHPIFKAMGMRDTQPVDTLYNRPIVYSDFLSPTHAANRVLLVFGDFWAAGVCRRAGDVELATDPSVFFDRNQIAYRGILYEAVAAKNPDQLVFGLGA